MTTRQARAVMAMLAEIKAVSQELPRGKYYRVYNRCEKIALIAKRSAQTK